jgi:hypothetical protein
VHRDLSASPVLNRMLRETKISSALRFNENCKIISRSGEF